jgi:hypothetical protein
MYVKGQCQTLGYNLYTTVPALRFRTNLTEWYFLKDLTNRVKSSLGRAPGVLYSTLKIQTLDSADTMSK